MRRHLSLRGGDALFEQVQPFADRANKAFLGGSGDQVALAVEKVASNKTSRTTSVGGFFGKQKPVVCAERAVKPNRMI